MVELTRRTLISTLPAVAGVMLLAHGKRAFGAVGDTVRVTDFRQAGDADDTAAFSRALATGHPVHVPAGAGSGANGAYHVVDIVLPPGSIVAGDGMGRTVIRPVRGRSGASVFFTDSGGPSNHVAGLRIRGMTLQGWSAEDGFAEHHHLMHMNGVDDLVIENVEFRGFQGDGLYLGSSRRPGIERHNRRIVVRGCLFDGVNHENRQGISILDGDDVLIQDCTFRNCTHANMPGAIDAEPDSPNRFAIVRRIAVDGCRFENVGGNVGCISFVIPAAVAAIPSQIRISGNTFSNYRGTGAEIHMDTGRRLTAADPDMAVSITGNRGSGGHGVYSFRAVKGVRIAGNTWQDYRHASGFGYTQPNQVARDVSVADTFTRCGTGTGVGIYVFSVSGLTLDGTQLIDCGNGGIPGYAICFGAGQSERVSLRNVRIASPTGRTRIAVIREPQHRMSPSTNSESANDFGGLPALDITTGA